MGSNCSNNDTPAMPKDTAKDIEFKAKLERKICIAKETPEPEYDLSECNLKTVPHGVFIMCKVLLKESLLLNCNKLTSLEGGGSLLDLNRLQALNLNDNKLKKLPEEIGSLAQLKELFVSANSLEKLPTTISRLQKLQILDISHNHLTKIEAIACMPELRILNVRGNPKLQKLHNELSTCDSLSDLVVDSEYFNYPPASVLVLGTKNILKFLSTGEFTLNLPVIGNDEGTSNNAKAKLESFVANEKRELHLTTATLSEKYSRENMLLAIEREAQEKNYMLEAQLHEKQKQKQQELTSFLLNQQNETDLMVMKLHENKETERNRLISNILEAEQMASTLVNNLLQLKCGPDAAILALEKQEQELLLEKIRIKENDFRKQDILNAMSDLLKQETYSIQNYQNQKDQSSRHIIEQESQTNELLNFVFHNYDRNRSAVIEKITSDEVLQKSAVSKLIERNDSRSWALVEQVRIVESQLAAMTIFELERKKWSIDEQMNNLAAQRLDLTYVLLDLLDQQDRRKKQLFNTLQRMEDQNDDNQQDFWLLQYQKLIDSQPIEVSQQTAAIDSVLGYQILVNGVIHTLPFFSKLWMTRQSDLKNVTDADLLVAGVNNQRDRVGILRSIEAYLRQTTSDNNTGKMASATPIPLSTPTTTNQSNFESASAQSPSGETNYLNNKINAYYECVICMDNECQIIFLPCGHLCSCVTCQLDLSECPMCRGTIENKIKVIKG